MNRALFLKELAHHGPAVLWLAAGTLAGFPILAFVAAKEEAGSVFEGVGRFLGYLMPLLAAVLCHRLVVLEYQARTQLFLEGLPVSRGRMVAVKYLFGLGALWGLALLAFVLALLVQTGSEPLDARLLAIMLTRALGWTWCILSFFFLMGFLGRCRGPAFLLVWLAIDLVCRLKEIRLREFGPFVLVDSHFAYERDVLPWGSLGQAALLGALVVGLTAGLVRLREGSVAALLGERMSRRERGFFAALAGSLLVLLVALPDRKEPMAVEAGSNAKTARVGAAVVKVSCAETFAPAADRLALRAAQELASAHAYLGLTNVLPVFITLRPDLVASRFENDDQDRQDCVQVSANFSASDWREEDFIAWLLRETLLVQSRGRAELERKLWVLDGFPYFWLAKSGRALPSPAARNRVLTLRTLYGTREGLTQRDLETWLRFRERVGPELAGTVAGSGLAVLERRQGVERCRDFLRRVLTVAPPKDFRAALHELRFPPARLLELEAGVTLDEFVQAWQAELDAARGPWHAELAALPVVRGEVRFAPLTAGSDPPRPGQERGATLVVHYTATASPPPPEGVQWLFLHSRLTVLDRAIAADEVRRAESVHGVSAKGELPQVVSRGGRFGWTVSLDVPALDCAVISGWRREEVR